MLNKSPEKIDFFIISTGRAASTAVYKYLNDACVLNLPWNKEPHHWFDIMKYKGTYPLLEKLYVNDRQEYFALYDNSSMSIDASCGYFFYLEEVIQNLHNAAQCPKVLFLYREPVSRAASIFNEWKKKGLTSSENVLQDILLAEGRETGYWWEYYYDNVMYMNQYNLMKEYFKDMMLVNYRAFAKDPASVFKNIADFLNVRIVNNIDYSPVNSSFEAKKSNKTSMFSKTRYLPGVVKVLWERYRERKSKSEDMKLYEDLPELLPNSVKQYDLFRKSIDLEDVLCINR